MKEYLFKLKKSRPFQFISSVKMAVLLMLTLGAVVGSGTVYESLYNAEVARMRVYHTWWFLFLLALLWINIAAAALSRIPYKKHHTGFVVTHLGMLTMMWGAAITYMYGIDGQLFVQEGSHAHSVILPELAIKVIRQGSEQVMGFPFTKTLERSTPNIPDFSALTGLTVQDYIPAARRKGGGGAAAGTVVGFRLKSNFFDVEEALHSTEKPQIQMGPATIRLVTGPRPKTEDARPVEAKAKGKKTAPSMEPSLLVLDAKSGAELARVPLRELAQKAPVVRGVKLELVKEYKNAVVGNNKIAEGTNKNPALELKLSKAGSSAREVIYEKFPTFSLSPNGFFGLRVRMSGFGEAEAATAPATAEAAPVAGNVIEFHVDPGRPDEAGLVLLKNGERLLSRSLKVGEVAETPWMGMRITLASVKQQNGQEAMADDVAPVEIPRRSPLPSSAVKIGGQWFLEGEAKRIANGQENFEIFYGQNSVDLPFEVNLHKFEKIDYPGTEKAMSFQSQISINGEAQKQIVMMNEPFEKNGFLLYQSSYQLEPGQPPVSVFSVNRDPGRWVKYFGAVVLSLGILLFIVMRSRWYILRFQGGAI